MDFYTKMFLINFFILFVVANADRRLFDDGLENGKYTKHLWAVWNVITILSIPVWIIYLIATW